MLKDGKDPNREARVGLIGELFGFDIGYVSKRIVDEIIGDYC